ncbi:hypothetical protein ACWDXV_34265 [Nocardia nova]
MPAQVHSAWARWTNSGGWHAASGLPKPVERTVSAYLIRAESAVAEHNLRLLRIRGINARRREGFGALYATPSSLRPLEHHIRAAQAVTGFRDWHKLRVHMENRSHTWPRKPHTDGQLFAAVTKLMTAEQSAALRALLDKPEPVPDRAGQNRQPMKTTLFTIPLRMRIPGGVTAPEEQRFDDIINADNKIRTRNTRPLRRDPAGRVQLPGTSLAGSLRAHCSHDPLLAEQFGPAPGAARGASPIQELGSLLRTQAATIRGRTAIDREQGAARNHMLHADETLAAGAEFDMYLRWNNATDPLIIALLDALARWSPALCTGASVGAGRVDVTGIGHHTYDLATQAGLLAWLLLTDSISRTKNAAHRNPHGFRL